MKEFVLPTELNKIKSPIQYFELEHLLGEQLKNKIKISDPQSIQELKTYFLKFSIKKDIFKVLPEYHLSFHYPNNIIFFRVTKSGMILLDVAASSIQNGYTPKKANFIEFLDRLFLDNQ